jgi:hypothetical protein
VILADGDWEQQFAGAVADPGVVAEAFERWRARPPAPTRGWPR